jgi:phasin family protein
MAKGPMTNLSAEARDYAGKNAERAMRAANHGMSWLLDLAEQNLEQSKAAFENYLMTARKAMDTMDHQASDMRERSMSLAETTLTNTFDFAHKACRVRDPQELVQVQTDFIGRQAQAVVEQAKNLGQSVMHDADEVVGTTMRSVAESSRRRAEESA